MSKAPPWLASASDSKGTKSKGPAGRRATSKKSANKKPAPARKPAPGLPAVKPPKAKPNKATHAKQESQQAMAAQDLRGLSYTQLENGLAPHTVDRYRRFVHEYVKDYNKAKAYQRSSEDREELDTKTLNKRALVMFWQPYVQLYLEAIRSQLMKKAVFTGEAILNRLWEEANSTERDASAGTRCMALNALAKATGIDKPADSKQTKKVGHSSGVMVVPGYTFDEWSAAAEVSQAALKEEAVKGDAA